ncbi:HNH endonuclease [Symbioplanes lichenis]|uniref:HNH endonuclease n=1 Tax=Symbioplanes lichenis TaxID=1629072 RepID=UPI0027395DFE|nr:HNH endonuclease signature motif containing protein [Actinoplanes lichenis]
MSRYEDEVVLAATRYAVAADAGRLLDLKDLCEMPAVKDDRAALKDLYTSRLVRQADARRYYDKLKAAAPFGQCPLCGHRDVSTLDHQLPKSSYPLLAVVPDNLVPACADCNKNKSAAVATTDDAQTLHPYFDDAGAGQWLFATVNRATPATVTFSAEPPLEVGEVMRARIRAHFAAFGLAGLYAMQASRMLAGQQRALAGLFELAGSAAVVAHLREQADSWWGRFRNCWQFAMYQALAGDEWFVGGGLRG